MDTKTKISNLGESIVFTYREKFPISFKASGGRTMINATQMAQSFGKLPSVWLRLVSTDEFRHNLVKRGESSSYESQVITTKGRNNNATWIEQSLAVEFARWLSPEFSKWCNDRVSELLTQGSVSIKQPPVHSSQYPVPTTFKEALLLAAQQQEEIERQREIIKENSHKVAFYEQYIENRDWFRSSRIADELSITTFQLHTFLAENGVCEHDKAKKRWVALPAFRALQCDVPYYWENKQGKTYAFGSTKRWTQGGREYIIDLWYEKHPELQKNLLR